MVSDDKTFLIDANCFIAPYHDFYAFDLVPKYWEILAEKAKTGRIVLLDKVKRELDTGGDKLSDWMKSNNQFKVCSINDEQIIDVYAEIMQYIQESEFYSDKALNQWADDKVADPWLIAAAKVKGYIIVTFEGPNTGLNKNNPSKNAKIPDVASAFGVKTCNLYTMMRELAIKID